MNSIKLFLVFTLLQVTIGHGQIWLDSILFTNTVYDVDQAPDGSKVFTTNDSYVSGLAFSNNILATSSGDRKVKLWTIELNQGQKEDQVTYSCQNEAYKYLSKLIGNWDVNTKDRTSLGKYEENNGTSIITSSIPGCGIKESFRGVFRNKDYAREVTIIGKDALEVEMMALDSEHASFSKLNGKIENGKMIVYWFRDDAVKRLQSKYILDIQNDNQFEFSSFLSTDHGATWALTHERKYKRVKQGQEEVSGDSTSIQNLLTAYYDCISGPIGEVRDFDRLKSLFHPNARLIYSHWNEEISEASLMVFNIDEFIGKLDYLDKKGFYEEELSNEIHFFGSVIQVFSTYQFRVEDKSIPNGRGITSYELFFDGSRYWIISMFWNTENEKYMIPERYLK